MAIFLIMNAYEIQVENEHPGTIYMYLFNLFTQTKPFQYVFPEPIWVHNVYILIKSAKGQPFYLHSYFP